MRRELARACLEASPMLFCFRSRMPTKSEKLSYKANDTAKKAMESFPTIARSAQQSRDMLHEAVKDDPRTLDAHNSLGQCRRSAADYDEAGKEFTTASALDPTDQKLMRQGADVPRISADVESANTRSIPIKSGDVTEGMAGSEGRAAAKHSQSTRDQRSHDRWLRQAVADGPAGRSAGPADKKYDDAMKTYDQAVRGYMLLASRRRQAYARSGRPTR